MIRTRHIWGHSSGRKWLQVCLLNPPNQYNILLFCVYKILTTEKACVFWCNERHPNTARHWARVLPARCSFCLASLEHKLHFITGQPPSARGSRAGSGWIRAHDTVKWADPSSQNRPDFRRLSGAMPMAIKCMYMLCASVCVCLDEETPFANSIIWAAIWALGLC